MHGDFGWSLPPGVTDAMIDDAMGEADDRDECPDCRVRSFTKADEPCDTCDGTGRIAPPEREYDRGDR